MSAWSPTCQQSVLKRCHSDKHFSEFLPTRWRQKSTGIDMEQNYATVTLCLSVSVCHKSEIYRNGWTNELVFGMGASFCQSYTVLKGNSGISKYKGTSLWNFVLNFGLRKFCFGISVVETCYQLSSRKLGAQSVIHWTVVVSWQYLRAPTLVH